MRSSNILAISGSLRDRSFNRLLLLGAAALAPESMNVSFYGGLGELPHFNPDLDGDHPPTPVTLLRTQLKAADGVIICTPEYANGVPGVLKNGLDWIVSSGELTGKPTAMISASPYPTGGDKAHASLLLTLKMMGAAVVEGGTLMIPYVLRKVDAEGRITDPVTESALRSLLCALAQAERDTAPEESG